MVDFAIEAQRGEDASTEDAILRAGLLRFQPILMTTCAALFGALPLALGPRLWLRAAPSVGRGDRGRTHRISGAVAVHHPVVYLALERLRRSRPVHSIKRAREVVTMAN